MKYTIVLFMLIAGMVACKSKKENTQSVISTIKTEHTGVVMHEYKKNGCSAVIKVTGPDDLYLIPKDELGKFDKDGLKIAFNYLPLRMPMREGCTVGMMAEVTDISEIK